MSPMPFPIQFAVHTWIVTEHAGKEDRFDVFGFIENRKERFGHLYKNYKKPFVGCPIFALGRYRLFENTFTWKTEILYTIEGEEQSDAAKIYTLLYTIGGEEPFISRYSLYFGPNSNSFTNFVLNQVAPGRYPLPWRAIGKDWQEGAAASG